jgi:hypothetical protein
VSGKDGGVCGISKKLVSCVQNAHNTVPPFISLITTRLVSDLTARLEDFEDQLQEKVRSEGARRSQQAPIPQQPPPYHLIDPAFNTPSLI